ncbi:MAG: hypothetical protein IJU35_02805 [Paludibacteraceae bacterium]|nr:hypothetical protein [Paludibacteraceae bacterium]
MKAIVNTLLIVATCLLCYFWYMSVQTPIKFDEQRSRREQQVVAHLIQIRNAQVEYKNANGRYASQWDSLLIFLKTAKKKEVMKEGSLTEAQLEAGLTEEKAVKIILSGKEKDIIANGLQNFKRDTIFTPMIDKLYAGVYTAENIDSLIVVPFSNGKQFELEVNNDYKNSSDIKIPLFEARTPYEAYLGDLNHQLLVNIKDEALTLEKYPGLKVGSVEAPNNNAGNWE